uniref:Phosphoribosylaminoimidazole carboxylase n=1 Tax=Ganoderma boninense TaxID=34458 RepID=A0A5K1JWR4_9APHY|nr:Phosphoribosylaminoimidazole carboxylase (EC (AIR carboxylase) (AIRC) [Ganoderma boninense]
MLKSRTLAYDGRGNFVLNDLSQAEEAIAALGGRTLYAEKWVPFVKEVAVMVVRSRSGEVVSYPVVETVHKQNICHLVFAPLRSRDPAIAARARAVAENAVKTLKGAGVFGVEMFLMADEITSFAKFSLTIPGARVHLYGKSESRKGRKMGHVTVVADSDAQLSLRLRPLLTHLPGGHDPRELDLYAPLFPERGFSHKQSLVGVIMGSDSDLHVMLPAADILTHFKVPYELTIVSAHRTPDRLVEYARSAAARGLKVIIAGAGGAAHLPGMVAAMTALPVIGIPVKGSSLDGVDSLHSIVQMPRGIPVATVAINNGTNAGLLAVRILSAGQPELVGAMEGYLRVLETEVLGKVDKIAEVGWNTYEAAKKAQARGG